jgi:hypothetical protein
MPQRPPRTEPLPPEKRPSTINNQPSTNSPQPSTPLGAGALAKETARQSSQSVGGINSPMSIIGTLQSLPIRKDLVQRFHRLAQPTVELPFSQWGVSTELLGVSLAAYPSTLDDQSTLARLYEGTAELAGNRRNRLSPRVSECESRAFNLRARFEGESAESADLSKG